MVAINKINPSHQNTQQLFERVKIALADVVNNLSLGRFNYQVEFTGKNLRDLNLLKEKLEIYHDYHGFGQVDAVMKDFTSSITYYSKARPLGLCESRVKRELLAHAQKLSDDMVLTA